MRTPRGSFHRSAKSWVLFALIVGFAMLAGCVSAGSDPVVVNAERALRASDVLYKESMAYYFRPGVTAILSPQATQVFEKIRTGFDPAYKAVQGALDLYKLSKSSGDLYSKLGELARIMNAAIPLLDKPNLKPVEVN